MRTIVRLTLVVVVFTTSGCSNSTGPKIMRVWGDVSYDGQPISEGSLDFISPEGAAPAQATIKDGHFDLPAHAGLLAGKTHIVQINSLKKTGKTIQNMMGDGAPTMEVLANIIPQKYNVKSDLKAAVSDDSSKNQFDFKLQKGR